MKHDVPEGFSERPERLRAIQEALSDARFAALERREATIMPLETATLAHDLYYLDYLDHARPREGMVQLGEDVVMSAKSWEAILRSMGGGITAVDAVMEGEARNAFCATRPPGHHTGADYTMGFCFLNNAAIAARYAQETYGLERVAIVDFDVHHGNGTQDIFINNPSVLYASLHQSPCYPGTGKASEKGAGNIFNEPLEPGSDGEAMQLAMLEGIIPALNRFNPELIIVSAGFDAHWRDDISDLRWTGDDYAWITRQLMAVANTHCNSRLVSILEGGYNLEGLAEGVAMHVTALMQTS